MVDTTRYAAPWCGTCNDSMYVDYGDGGYELCPVCQPMETPFDSGNIAGPPEVDRYEEPEDEGGAGTLITGMDAQLRERENIAQLSYSQTPRKVRRSSSVDSLSSAGGSIFSIASATPHMAIRAVAQ
jgi:hypothetical protein